MDENTTPPEEPTGATSGNATGDGAGTTPPPPPGGPTGQPGGYGPRVTSSEIRDVARLRRSTTDRHIAGVAGGLARHLDLDPLLIRVVFVVLAFFGGAGIFLYGALWLLVPEDAGDERAAIDLDPRSRGVALIVAAGIASLVFLGNALGGFGADHDGFWFPLFPALVIGGIVWLVLRRKRERTWRAGDPYAATPPPGVDPAAYIPTGSPVPPVPAAWSHPGAQLKADMKANPEKYKDFNSWKFTGDYKSGYRWVRDPRKKGPLLFWIAVPLIALALGTLGVFDLAGYDVLPAAYPALALGIVATGLLLGSFWGRAGGLILLGLLLVPVTTIATVADEFEGEDVRYAPTAVADIPTGGYHIDMGKLVVDLSGITDPEALDGKVVEASVNVGEIEMIIPDEVNAEAIAEIEGPGGIDLLGRASGGIGTSDTAQQTGAPGAPDWHVVARADVGHIEIRSK